jgi:hypothetical protein
MAGQGRTIAVLTACGSTLCRQRCSRPDLQKFFDRGLILAMSDALTHHSAYFDAGATR